MRLPEQRLWDRMRANMGTRLYLERIENMVGEGNPDVNAMTKGVTIPLELKVVDRFPTRATTPVLGTKRGLNQNQLNWWLRWKEWGGRGFIVVGVGLNVYFVPCQRSENVNQMNTYALEIYAIETWSHAIARIHQEVECVRTQ